MQITVMDNEYYATILPSGDLDANSSIQMDEQIRGLLDSGRKQIHVDCRGLNYISSAGLGVFISYLEEVRGMGGDFIFSGMSDKILRVFELLGLNQVMRIVAAEEDAAKGFKK